MKLKQFAAAAFLAVTLGGCATVGTGYRGVVLSWGSPTGEIKSEGITFLMPFSGLDIKDMNVQTQADKIQTAARSRDSQIVKTEVTVNFHLDPAHVGEIYDKLRDEVQDRVLDPTVHDAVTAATGKFKAQDLVANRDVVATAIDNKLRAKMAPYHVIIEQVLVTNIEFDSAFQSAVEQTMTAQQELATAKIEAQKAEAQAKGAAMSQQAQRQTLTPLILRKQAIDKWDGHFPTYMSGSNAPINLIMGDGEK
jgi:regulator of protease activity HflC (stomatin/prohibitin superfamily)